MIDDKKLMDSLRKHEGYRDKAYQDSEGIWTIGYGTNLQELRIDEELAERWLRDMVTDSYMYAERFPEYELLSGPRKAVFIEMIYNMGPSRVAGFKNMLRAIRDGDWEEAAMEMLDSKWARQVGRRARRLAEQMESGIYWNDDGA